ncbi:TPA: hypothetical protein ACIX5I_005372, partial [Escherichia coli]
MFYNHGSKDYWSPENASLFVPAIFVQCVTPSKNHPHPDVTLDIEKTGCTVQYAKEGANKQVISSQADS